MTRRRYRVTVADVAEDDLFEIVDYILMREREVGAALEVRDRIEGAIVSLRQLANRGRAPPELREVGTADIGFDLRELIEWPWRIVYRVRGRDVYVVMILDGRRDAGELVRERAMRLADYEE